MSNRVARLRPLGRTDAGAAAWPEEPWYRSPRARLFLGVFVLAFAIGGVATLLQETSWRTSAVVLMSADLAVDDTDILANTQRVAIQSRVLLGPEVMAALALQSQTLGVAPQRLQSMLQVTPVDDTNLVEMSATGSEPGQLAPLVNTWIDVYLEKRAEETTRRKEDTLQQVEDELGGLDRKLEEARQALDAYRREHDIISAQREENEVLARLDGLNAALNRAVEDEVRARARLDSLSAAIQQGERVMPEDQQRDFTRLEAEFRKLQADIAEMEQRYTRQYINKHPELSATVERFEEVQLEMELMYENGRESALTAARQAYAEAQQAVADLENKLVSHRDSVARFTAIYATHNALAEDLARLEELSREAKARQVQVEIRDYDKYPEVTVVQHAAPESERVGPDYAMLLGASFGGAVLLGIFSVWLRSFLAPAAPQQPAHVSVELVPPATGIEQREASRLNEEPAPRLDQPEDEKPA